MHSSLPLTVKKPGESQSLWGQREYVEAVQRGYGFAAHRYWWHWSINGKCYSMHIPDFASPGPVVTHSFKPDINWITKCSAAVAGKVQP